MKRLILFFIFSALLPAMARAENIETINLSVPFIPEVHDGIWLPPWNNACEESSITMIDRYYSGITNISVANARALMLPLFDIEDKMFGSHADTDAARTAELANQEMGFLATVKENPTIDDIKNQIRQGRPVISMHYGFGLNNPHHRFRRGGSSYHTIVISGFDDAKKEFITQDSGDYNGSNYRYSYDVIINTLHDFDHVTGRADGPPRVVFTVRRMLAKAEGSSKIYYILDGTKHYITHPDLFKKFSWQWRNVRIVRMEFLNKFTDGKAVTFDTSADEIQATAITIEEPDRIVKTDGSTRIYLIKKAIKHYITHPSLFKIHGWSWSSVETVNKAWLDGLSSGEAIRN